MTDSSPSPATGTRIRRVVWLPTTRTGKVALTLAYLTVLSAALMYFLGWLTTAQFGAAP